jgi:hypothetical protein
MRIPLEVTHTTGVVESCIAEYPDLCAFEERFSRSVLRLNTELRLTDLGFLAWHALQRVGKHSLPFEEWNLTVAIVQSTDEDVDLVPLER